jgi:hypothetical protein
MPASLASEEQRSLRDVNAKRDNPGSGEDMLDGLCGADKDELDGSVGSDAHAVDSGVGKAVVVEGCGGVIGAGVEEGHDVAGGELG